MPQLRDDEQLSPSADASATNLATAELDPEEKALFDHETRLNDAIDTNLRSNIDRDPRAVWLLEENTRYEYYEFYYRMMVDCLPLAGAIMSDSYLNKWWALFWGSLVIILGTIPMALFAGWDAIVYVNNSLLFMPLATVTLGVGLIAPTIDAFSGDQFLEIQERGRDRSFSVLFFLSRIGVLIADSIFAGLPLYGINVNYQLPWRHVFYPVLLVACGAPVLTLILCIGRSRFRIMSSSGEFILYRILKIPIVAAFRYVAASKTERAAAGHWLNFAARDDAEGSLFVQELHDFGLVLALLLLPSFIFSIMDRHTIVLAQHLSQFLADNESEFSEQTQWRSTVLNFSSFSRSSSIRLLGALAGMCRRIAASVQATYV
ncbi:hypothetical protein DFQ26_007298 [Actinomortierella ambigua]|nr:hypothetical protein DFQ26_007298 [Actinomortierella ambigua]